MELMLAVAKAALQPEQVSEVFTVCWASGE